jgi:hypothetical protein
VQVEKQFAWLKRDLANVNRMRTPWVITMAHRPMYCSNSDDADDCTKAGLMFGVGGWALRVACVAGGRALTRISLG